MMFLLYLGRPQLTLFTAPTIYGPGSSTPRPALVSTVKIGGLDQARSRSTAGVAVEIEPLHGTPHRV